MITAEQFGSTIWRMLHTFADPLWHTGQPPTKVRRHPASSVAGNERLPTAPTPEMIEAGMQVLCQMHNRGQVVTGIRTADDARDVWLAMQAAAPREQA